MKEARFKKPCISWSSLYKMFKKKKYWLPGMGRRDGEWLLMSTIGLLLGVIKMFWNLGVMMVILIQSCEYTETPWIGYLHGIWIVSEYRGGGAAAPVAMAAVKWGEQGYRAARLPATEARGLQVWQLPQCEHTEEIYITKRAFGDELVLST